MPKRQLAPQISEISAAEHKSRKRRIKRLVQLRLAYGKGTFFETRTHKARYPIEEISIALYKALCKANKINKHLDLSTEEKLLWEQIFKVITIAFATCWLLFYADIDGDGRPDFFEFLNHSRPDPDFIEKVLEFKDDAIEKTLGLPAHRVEQFLKPGTSAHSDCPRNPEKDG